MNVSCLKTCLLKSIDIFKYLISFNFVRLAKNKEAVDFELRTAFKLGLNMIQKFKGLRQSYAERKVHVIVPSLSDNYEQCTHSALSAVKCVKHAQEISKQIEEIEYNLFCYEIF
jgi:hypothetical protein